MESNRDKEILRKARRDKTADITHKYWSVFVIAIIAVTLIVGGFFVPPMGVIDGSILTATGELIAIMGIFVFIVRAESGSDITFRKGDMEIHIDNDDCIGQQDAVSHTPSHHDCDCSNGIGFGQENGLASDDDDFLPPPCRMS